MSIRALKRITSYIYAGIGYNLDYHSSIKSDEPSVELNRFTAYPYGTAGSSVSSGVSLNLLYDTRNNSINPLPGSYANIVYRVNPTFLGSDNSLITFYREVFYDANTNKVLRVRAFDSTSHLVPYLAHIKFSLQ